MIFLLLIAIIGIPSWLAWYWLYATFWCSHVDVRERCRWQTWRKEHPVEAAAADAAYRRDMAAHAAEHQTEYLRVIASTPFPPRTV